MIYIKIINGYHLSEKEMKDLWKKLKVHGTPIDLIEKYLLYREDGNFGIFFGAITSLYDLKLTVPQLKRILVRICRLSQKTLIPIDDAVHFIETSIGELDYAPVPPWVTVEEGENISLLTEVDIGDSKIQAGKYEELLDRATDIFYSFMATPEKSGGTLVQEKIPLDIRKTVQAYLSSVSSDGNVLATRVFGPQNAFMDHDCPYNLKKMGPCRMLNCYCRGSGDLVTDAQSDEIEWFDGSCDVCRKGIRDKSHALRYPYKNGGWVGVYCSIDCLRESEFFNEEEDYDQYIRMENLGATLKQHGIMDRTRT